MLQDAFPNARYNAAIGLCRHGDTRAVPVLLAMLDAQNSQVVEGEVSDSERVRKRSLVMMNAIRAAGRLAARKPASDLSDLHDRLAQIRDSDLPQALQNAASEALTRFPGCSTPRCCNFQNYCGGVPCSTRYLNQRHLNQRQTSWLSNAEDAAVPSEETDGSVSSVDVDSAAVAVFSGSASEAAGVLGP